MPIKKILMMTALGFTVAITSTAWADYGYPDQPVVDVANHGYYIDGHIGYGSNDYYNSFQWRANSGVSNNNSGSIYGGVAGGLDLGYNINQSFGVELGWMHLPSVNVAGLNSTTSLSLPSVYLTSWSLDLAAKYVAPLAWINNTNWFFKVGIAYRRAAVSTTAMVSSTTTDGSLGISNGISNSVRPWFATGIQYNFTDAWSGIFQYAYYLGASNAFPLKQSVFNNTVSGGYGILPVNVFTWGLGYKFSV